MLLNEFVGKASQHIEAPADEVFRYITDLDRLPEWNANIPAIVERANGPLAKDVEWVVRINALGTHWHSRSRVVTYDPDCYRFEHFTQSDDGNPSYANWRWQVTPSGDGTSRLDVSYDVHPRTFWRRALFAKIRRHQLPEEVSTSLATIATQIRTKAAIH
jgi:uncharacterized protein YndB with AHSA1/START domain